MSLQRIALRSKCVATAEAKAAGDGQPDHFFREAQFSDDGTSIVTLNDDQCLRTFILPPDLLDGDEKPKVLQEYAAFRSPASVQSYAIHPSYDLQDPATTLVLHSATDQPLSLRNSLNYSTVAAKYNNVSPTTEAYLTSFSLAFSRDGSRFISGGNNHLSIFDCYQGYSDPVLTHRLAPGRKARRLYGEPRLSCKGIVSALATNSASGLLAVGTTEREIGLFPDEGRGECLVSFSIAKALDNSSKAHGTGIMHLKWSPNGKYLLAAERQSDCIQLYDVRNLVRRVSWLSGRKAETTQRLSFDVVPTEDGFEVWAGGKDGVVRMWKNPGSKEDEHTPDTELKLHDDAVSSAVWHPGGAVLASCSGQRYSNDRFESDNSEDDGELLVPASTQPHTHDNKLAIWMITPAISTLE
ncbi:hypothetical protein LTR62_005934 [Meristemomyces frigidus]|uniref:Uncharacterized protein n=1 Tax=Meristemomyces frigidus TaxID=1508187 RepID=A0AAN7YJU5_9PEZI|nr:hypothetical protein LTR62_005934 [Meristemomyces frigidus]